MTWYDRAADSLLDWLTSPIGWAGLGMGGLKVAEKLIELRKGRSDARAKDREHDVADRQIDLKEREMTFGEMKAIVLDLRNDLKSTNERLDGTEERLDRERTLRREAEDLVIALRDELHWLRNWLARQGIGVPEFPRRKREGDDVTPVTVLLPAPQPPD